MDERIVLIKKTPSTVVSNANAAFNQTKQENAEATVMEIWEVEEREIKVSWMVRNSKREV